jgi:hypothetical protein
MPNILEPQAGKFRTDNAAQDAAWRRKRFCAPLRQDRPKAVLRYRDR